MDNKLSQLEKRRKITIMGGGDERRRNQHEKGKKTARERLDKILDENSFVELGVFSQGGLGDASLQEIKNPGEGVVTGYGTIDGRTVYIFAQDFTVAGGSLGEVHAAKICRVLDLAAKNGTPVIGLNDSGGARIQEGVHALNGYGDIFYRNTIYSGVVPQISVILGPCAGGAVYSPALTDFVFMAEKTSYMFITGPQVIKAVTGEEVSQEELGGAETHNRTSGVAHFSAGTEDECLQKVKTLLGYLPSNNIEDPPRCEPEEPQLDSAELNTLVPGDVNKGYDIREVIGRITDGSRFLEVHQDYARNAVIGFAHIGGQSVGLVANQPLAMAGCLDINSSDKISRFVRFCDCFNIPLITFVDVPGYLPGVQQEWGGVIRHGAKILYSYAEATVPRITVILRKAYGGAYLAMDSRSLGSDISLAWPTAEIAVMGPEGAVNIINRKEIEAAADPVEERQRLIEEYRRKFANPYIAAGRGWIDDVIEPRRTRLHLLGSLEALRSKRESRPLRKHGNMPL
ncbi:MAG: methylmalonyl-CoA carboxyltransferase [Firmicutes bacterium]|nr:methylmalonyl-CoA carboxyltransferase [Bacillota bacterium]